MRYPDLSRFVGLPLAAAALLGPVACSSGENVVTPQSPCSKTAQALAVTAVQGNRLDVTNYGDCVQVFTDSGLTRFAGEISGQPLDVSCFSRDGEAGPIMGVGPHGGEREGYIGITSANLSHIEQRLAGAGTSLSVLPPC